MLGTSRRAELFARALDGETVDDAEVGRLLGVASRLTAMQVAVPAHPAMRTAGRAAVVGAAGVALAEATRHAAVTGAVHTAAAHTAVKAGFLHGLLSTTAVAVATGVAAVAVGTTAVGVAAHRSLPGDPFYGVKRTGESARLHLAGSDADRATVRLAEARTRLGEIRALWPEQASDAHTAQIASLVASMNRDVALATAPLLAAGRATTAELAATVTALQTELASFPHMLTGAGASATTGAIALLGTLGAKVSALPVLVPGSGPTGVAPTAPTRSAQVVAPATPAAPSAPRAGTSAPSTPTTVAPPATPTAPVSVPPVTLPGATVSVPPVAVPSAVAPVTSALGQTLCQLLGTCPAP